MAILIGAESTKAAHTKFKHVERSTERGDRRAEGTKDSDDGRLHAKGRHTGPRVRLAPGIETSLVADHFACIAGADDQARGRRGDGEVPHHRAR